MKQLQPGIYIEEKKFKTTYWTKNLIPGQQVYDEKLIGTYRQWSTKKSKFAAALAKGIQNIKIKKNDIILYLGASTGTTVSHISDIIAEKPRLLPYVPQDSSPTDSRRTTMACSNSLAFASPTNNSTSFKANSMAVPGPRLVTT